MNGEKEINGKTYKGPSFMLRGITCSQINTNHAILVYLTFALNNGLRNLADSIEVPAICQISEGIEETLDKINFVDYECIGNQTVNENYELIGVKIDNIDENIIKNASNYNSNYNTLNDIYLFVIESEDFNNKTFIEKSIDFSFKGKINGGHHLLYKIMKIQ